MTDKVDQLATALATADSTQQAAAAAHNLAATLAKLDLNTAKHLAATIANQHPNAWTNAKRTLLDDATPYAHVALQLAHFLAVHEPNVDALLEHDTLPLLLAQLRAPDQLLRFHGLLLLAKLASFRRLVRPLCDAGITGLLLRLAKSDDGKLWHLILSISDGLLAQPDAIRPKQRQQLGVALLKCPLERADGRADTLEAAGRLLSKSDTTLLRRQLAVLRVYEQQCSSATAPG